MTLENLKHTIQNIFQKNIIKPNTVKIIKLKPTHNVRKEYVFEFYDKNTRRFFPNSTMKIYRGMMYGNKTWDILKPYEIIDNKLCVRFDPWHDCYIALTKEELINIINNMEETNEVKEN